MLNCLNIDIEDAAFVEVLIDIELAHSLLMFFKVSIALPIMMNGRIIDHWSCLI